MRRGLTIAEAARSLGISERTVRRHVNEGTIQKVGYRHALGTPLELDPDDVDKLSRMLRIGKGGLDMRTVLVVDPERRLDEHSKALQASGLNVAIGDTIMGALQWHPTNQDRPVMVLERPVDTERTLLTALRKKMDCIFVGPYLPDPFELDAPYWSACYDELRQVVQIAWMLVDRRK